ncbi:hypothetical protein GGX14DRAFT_422304 [Mycena pura]|uniref:Ino eighty subunit 1 n=1 Tax=Mycena pura TaxID=153505 RepID=A0AAD6YQD4_9AGAR|nr:hypothetical protein GGX14DRAFT_422304 [Mycena pura]
MQSAHGQHKKSARRTKRSVAIEHTDGQPITRADVQYDVLSHIFADETKAFTDPTSQATKLSFRDLYVNYILRSPKAKSVLKDKLSTPTFATDFAMLALLVNVGRIAATMSFFVEMRTVQRTYHPVPCLQRTNGNLLDAPRVKSVLKTCVLEGENKNGLSTPAQVLARAKARQIPPTTIPNLLFVLASHSAQIGRDHLADMEFLDLFLPSAASSQSRARIFLWLCYHYHEAPSANPDEDYDGDVALNPFSDLDTPGKVPHLVLLTDEEISTENVDTEEEKALAERLIAQRQVIARDHQLKESAKESKILASTPGGIPKSRSKNAKTAPSTPLRRKARVVEEEYPDEMHFRTLDDAAADIKSPLRAIYHRRSSLDESPSSPRSLPVPPHHPHSHRYSPYKPRTMLQHAWHGIATSDPLDNSDSDEEDEHDRRDHVERLAVISRVRGKAPTPEPDGLHPIPLHLDPWHDHLFV